MLSFATLTRLCCGLTLVFIFLTTKSDFWDNYNNVAVICFCHFFFSIMAPKILYGSGASDKSHRYMESVSLLFYYIYKCVLFYSLASSTFFNYDSIESLLSYQNPTTGKLNAFILLTVCHYISQTLVIVNLPVNNKSYMFIFHHFLTISVVMVCYVCNYPIATSMVIFLHDFSDIFLYLTLVVRESKNPSLKVYTFSIFYILFVVGRLVIYPIIFVAMEHYNRPLVDGVHRGWIFHYFPAPFCVSIFFLQCHFEKDLRGRITKHFLKENEQLNKKQS